MQSNIRSGSKRAVTDFVFCIFRYGTMQVLDSATKELVTTLKMNGSVDDIDFTHDGRNMLSIGDEGIVHVWDMNTRQCIHTFVDEVSGRKVFILGFDENLPQKCVLRQCLLPTVGIPHYSKLCLCVWSYCFILSIQFVEIIVTASVNWSVKFSSTAFICMPHLAFQHGREKKILSSILKYILKFLLSSLMNSPRLKWQMQKSI